jgi:vacuolar protein sorting-associated protein 13A/C
MDLVQPKTEKPLRFISSAATAPDQDHDLLTVAYVRAQKLSPEFVTVFEGIDQSIDIKVSTFMFRAAPEPIISLYDFVMTTFASQSNIPPNASEDLHKDEIVVSRQKEAEERIRILVKLASVQGQSDAIVSIYHCMINLSHRSHLDRWL